MAQMFPFCQMCTAVAAASCLRGSEGTPRFPGYRSHLPLSVEWGDQSSGGKASRARVSGGRVDGSGVPWVPLIPAPSPLSPRKQELWEDGVALAGQGPLCQWVYMWHPRLGTGLDLLSAQSVWGRGGREGKRPGKQETGKPPVPHPHTYLHWGPGRGSASAVSAGTRCSSPL